MKTGKINLDGVKATMGYAKLWNKEGWPCEGIRRCMDKADSSMYRTYSDSFVAECARIRDINETTRETIKRTLLPVDNYDFLLSGRMMVPFYNGHLTIYIGGDGNRNSWQLANELLDMPDLLPGNRERTMGVVVSIENNKSPELCLRYSDGQMDTLAWYDRQMLPELVSIDNAHARKLMEITVRLPLPQAYRHWRMVIDDQPAWDRQAEVEMNADVRVYVLAEENAGTVQRMIAMDRLPVRKNTFYVIMTGSGADGLRARRERLESARGHVYRPEERLHHCCIPAYRLINDGHIDYKAAEKSVTWPGWDEPVWSQCRRLISDTRQLLAARGLSFNNENIKRALDGWSGFNPFRQQLLKYMGDMENGIFAHFYATWTGVLLDYRKMMGAAISAKEKELGLDEGSLFNIRMMSEEMDRFKTEWDKTLQLLDYIQDTFSEEYVYSRFKGENELYTREEYLILDKFLSKKTFLIAEDIRELCNMADTLMAFIENNLQGKMPGMSAIKDIFGPLHENMELLKKLDTTVSLTIISQVICSMVKSEGLGDTPESFYRLVQCFRRYFPQKINGSLAAFVKDTFQGLETGVMKGYKYRQLWLNRDGKAVQVLEMLMNCFVIDALLDKARKTCLSL